LVPVFQSFDFQMVDIIPIKWSNRKEWSSFEVKNDPVLGWSISGELTIEKPDLSGFQVFTVCKFLDYFSESECENICQLALKNISIRWSI
jgi:hypothetical protein